MNRTASQLPIVELHVSQQDSASYMYAVIDAGTVLFEDAGFPSVSLALVAASKGCTDFMGIQVDFDGIVVGTYTPQEIAAKHEAVAALCIERRTTFDQPR